jgi:hypothetical protein
MRLYLIIFAGFAVYLQIIGKAKGLPILSGYDLLSAKPADRQNREHPSDII